MALWLLGYSLNTVLVIRYRNPPILTADAKVHGAIVALDEAPDVDPAKATRSQVGALHRANMLAWVVLTDGRDPPSQRSAPSTPP